jgi:hypothetical protein
LLVLLCTHESLEIVGVNSVFLPCHDFPTYACQLLFARVLSSNLGAKLKL